MTKREKEEIKKRYELCLSCPFNSKNASASGIYITNRIDLHCKFCGCNIELYTKCLTCSCSIEEENQKLNFKLPVRWVQFYKKWNWK